MADVPAARKLVQIAVQALVAEVAVRCQVTPFEDRPDALNPVRMHTSLDVLPTHSVAGFSLTAEYRQNQLIREVTRRVAKNTFLSAEGAEDGNFFLSAEDAEGRGERQRLFVHGDTRRDTENGNTFFVHGDTRRDTENGNTFFVHGGHGGTRRTATPFWSTEGTEGHGERQHLFVRGGRGFLDYWMGMIFGNCFLVRGGRGFLEYWMGTIDGILGLLDGDDFGGTAFCPRRARRGGLGFVDLWMGMIAGGGTAYAVDLADVGRRRETLVSLVRDRCLVSVSALSPFDGQGEKTGGRDR